MMKEPRFFVTGDCHGHFRKIDFFCRHHDTSKEDTMIILGDAGINYWLGKTDTKLKIYLSKFPISFLFVQGNHEKRASEITSYQKKKWRNGTVYYEKKFPDLLFAKDGEVYDFNGKKGIVIGGAFSVDKEYRQLIGLPWFESEQPSPEIKVYVEQQLNNCNWTVDYVLSHTCPLCLEPTDLFLNFLDQSKVDKTTEEWLGQIYRELRFEQWYFGHFHGNRSYSNAQMLFEEIRELGSDDFLQRVGIPKYRKGEWVMFYPSNNEEYMDGSIEAVDAYGTLGQSKEVSYDIELIDGTRYKHIPESLVESIESIRNK